MTFQPTRLGERVEALDIMRGVSLLGILLVNILAFNLPQPHIDMNNWFTEAMDIIWYQNLQVYVQSSFYPLFSMLFGYGLAMQFMKAQQNGQNVFAFIPRRLIILFVIGMLHALLVWWGDIIATYAFVGFFLLLLLRLTPGKLLAVAVVLNGCFYAFYWLIIGSVLHEKVAPYAVDITKVENAIVAYSTGSYGEAFMQRLADLSEQMSPFMWIMSLFTILPYMCVGAAAAKWRLVERARELKWLWLILAIVGVGAGLTLKSLFYVAGDTYLHQFLQLYTGGRLLAAGYGAVLVLLSLLPIKRVFLPFAKMGRMSMTMYLMQSVICALLFYAYGFGLYGKLDVAGLVYVAIGIYIAQVVLAELWLSKFKQGPVEAIIKKIVYRL